MGWASEQRVVGGSEGKKMFCMLCSGTLVFFGVNVVSVVSTMFYVHKLA